MQITPTRRCVLRLAAFAAAGRFSPLMGAGRTWQLGSNTAIEGFGLIEAISTVREIGFTAIEIHPMGVTEPIAGKFPGFQFDKLDSSQRRQIREALKGFRRVTTHLPYAGLDYMSQSREKRDASIRAVEIAMEATAFFGATLAVLHPQPLPTDSVEQMWPEYIRRFREWGDAARRLKFRIALETGYPRSVHQYLRLIQEVDHEAVGSTIDVGHQKQYEELVARVKPSSAALWKASRRITTLRTRSRSGSEKSYSTSMFTISTRRHGKSTSRSSTISWTTRAYSQHCAKWIMMAC